MTAHEKCLFAQDWGDVGEEVEAFWGENCKALADAALNLASSKDAPHADAPNLLDILNKHGTRAPPPPADGEQSRHIPENLKEQTGWGYIGQIHYPTNNTLTLLQTIGEIHTPNLLNDYWRDWGTPDQVWADLNTSGFGETSIRALFKTQEFYQKSVEQDNTIKNVIKGVDAFEREIFTAHAHVTATKRIIQELLLPVHRQLQDKTHGWRNHHFGPPADWESLAALDANAGELISYLDIMRENIETIKEIRDKWVALGDKGEAEVDKAILKHKEKCRSLKDGAFDCEGKELEQWKKDLAELRRQKEEWAAFGSEAQFNEVGGDIIPAAFVGQVMKRTFKEQCLLLANVYNISRHKAYVVEQQEPARLPYVPTGSINANACLMAQREPWGFLNQLTQDKSYRTLFDIRPELLSQLSPMIRLYKIESQAGPAPERQIEVTFDTHYSDTAHGSVDSILQNKDKRGFGVGLKSFNFSYEGSNPFAIKKSIKAKLVIFANSFDDLLAARGAGPQTFRYADLALKTGGKLQELLDRTDTNSSAIINNITKLNFRLKAVVGWQLPNGNWEGSRPIPQQDRSAIARAVNNSFVTLNLTPTVHEFDIDEQGRVIFTINYLAYIEDFFDQPNFDVFATSKNYMNALRRKLTISAFEQHCDPKQAAAKKEKEYEKINNEKRDNLNSILRKLVEQKKMYFIPIPYDRLAEFNRMGPFFDFNFSGVQRATENEGVKVTEDFKNQLGALLKKLSTDKNLTETKIGDLSNNEYVKFFYLSDLVNIVLENIESTLKSLTEDLNKSIEFPKDLRGTPVTKKQWEDTIKSEKERLRRLQFNFQHFRVLLGPIELYDYATGTGKNIAGIDGASLNLGDLPISVSYFMNWLTEKVLKREQTAYTLSAFLNDLLNGLVRNFLNEDRCHDLNIKQKTRIFQTVITSYKGVRGKTGENTDEITDLIRTHRSRIANASKLWMEEFGTLNPGRDPMGILNIMGQRDSPINTRQPLQEYNYLVYYGGRVMPKEKMRGDVDSDAAAGIWHYMIGRKEGIVKTIQLTKTDSPGLKEVRFEQEGYDGLSQLREVYDATITCYGAPNIFPGTYIYIDPKGFSPKDNRGASYEFKDAAGTTHTIDPFLLTRYGIGGYYMVVKTENKLGPGEFNTTITAKWVAETIKPGQKKGGTLPSYSKCRVESPAPAAPAIQEPSG